MTTITEAHIGRKGTFKGGKGIIRYVGETEFAEGVWIGLELETPTGMYLSIYICILLLLLLCSQIQMAAI